MQISPMKTNLNLPSQDLWGKSSSNSVEYGTLKLLYFPFASLEVHPSCDISAQCCKSL